jgi:alanine racemase
MSVALISRSRLANNMRVLQQAAGANCQLWPAVKANAYGHGAVLVSRVLAEELGYRTACVAYVKEAVELLEQRVGMRRLLVLGGMMPYEAPVVAAWEGAIETVVSTVEQIEALAKSGSKKPIGVHLKIDTGMSRQGCLPESLSVLLRSVSDHAPRVVLRGVMSHFAAADAVDLRTTSQQMTLFRTTLDKVSLPAGVVRHIANSAAILGNPESRLEAARPGIAVYGLSPGDGVSHAATELQPVLTLQSRVTLAKTVPAGTGVSYGHHYTTTRSRTVLACVSVGYGDGISRAQSNRMSVLIGGVLCPQLGRVTMDQIVVDATNVPNLVVGALVTVIGDHPAVTADTLAQQGNTINYEIVTALSARVTRQLV